MMVPDRVRVNYGLFPEDWYIEIWCLAHQVTEIGTGLFYKCQQNDHTLKIYESARERSVHDNGDAFVLGLRRSDKLGEIFDRVRITKKHFEQITGLKALSVEEYFLKCESVPSYRDIGATLIDFASLDNS